MSYNGNTSSCDKYTKCKFIDGTWIFPKNENIKFSKYVYLPYGYEPDSYSGGVQIFYDDRWIIWFDKSTYSYQTIPYKKTGYEIDLSSELYVKGIIWGAIAGVIIGTIISRMFNFIRNHL
jgi:hypothetical protein